MHWWVVLKAAAKYLRCAKPENHAPEELRHKRAAICAACPVLQRYPVKIGKFERVIGTCGTFGEESQGVQCGCIVLAECDENDAHATITVRGDRVHVSAAAKSACTVEQCPQGKW